MSLFQKINHEKNELIHFEKLLHEISKQEGISFSEACAVIAREAADHSSEIPWDLYEPFYLYEYNVISGFKRTEEFTTQSINFLKAMAFGIEYIEDTNPEFEGVYSRIDGEKGWYRVFYFKGTELATSFLDSNVTLPPCLEKFRLSAERRLKFKAERLAKAKAKVEQADTDVSVESLQKEVDRLQIELKNLSSSVPTMLGAFREDDPLMIAIQLRNTEWANYDIDDRKTVPSQEGLVAQIKEQYKIFNIPEIQARAIEKVACPIKRK